ncbi:MAG TPA: glycine--tRNA ligase [Verrucomicrobiales bacterium]|nr:glycine--tRNA ligase [Verrucomicrobiales bacterium]HIL70787.1 glycine--tRNA ligase [Verrucomicrobiota bacterium]
MAETKTKDEMEKIVSLCKRRGFIFQSSEIYGGINGFWDYGPLGVELKRNIKDYWWRCMTREREDIVGLDASIIMHPRTWEASGHTDTFSDPMVDCLLSKKRFRADLIEPQSGTIYHFTGAEATEGGNQSSEPYSVLLVAGKQPDSARKIARKYYTQRGISKPELRGETTEEIENTTRFNPENGSLLTEPREFNLMFKTYVGPVEDEENTAYLRPETAQAIFAQFKNVLEVSRKKLPMGICQIGKAFRNEINPRNYTFRSREFEQMELEFFIKPDETVEKTSNENNPKSAWGWKEWHRYWVEERLNWYEDIGLPKEDLELYEQTGDDLAHYAQATVDIMYRFPFGMQELEGIAARGNYDLTQHQKFSGKSMEYFDEDAREKYIPHVVEPSAGVDRLALALICNAYCEETITDDKGKTETRTVMRFHPRIAPIKVAVFPLLKNKPELVAKAREIQKMLKPHMNVFYDQTGAIGRRYRRQDEIGTPFGITVDFETLADDLETKDTVTLRERDSMKQQRVPIKDLLPKLLEKIL